MNYRGLLIVSLLFVLAQPQNSSNALPHSFDKLVTVSAISSSLKDTQYFSFDSLQANISAQEWYGFLIIDAPSPQFWMKMMIEMTTVSKKTGATGSTKIFCQTDHNDLHYCYVGCSQINIKEENLKVEFSLAKERQIQVRFEVDTVYNLKLGEELSLQRNEDVFSRVLRLDIKQLKQTYQYLVFEFSEKTVVDEFKNINQFLVALQKTPPDIYRYSTMSFSLWDNIEGAIFSFQQLEEVEYITFLGGITDFNTYVFRSSVIVAQNQSFSLEIGQKYNQLVDSIRNYNFKLPATRPPNIIYQLKIHINYYYDIKVTEVIINNKTYNQVELTQFLKDSGMTRNHNEITLKFGPTVITASFSLNLTYGNIFTISIVEIDSQLVELQSYSLWRDSLQSNQTQFLYFKIDTLTENDKIDFEVELQIQTNSSYEISFKNCVKGSLEQCKDIALSSNQTLKRIGLTALSPQKLSKSDIITYRFKSLKVTKYKLNEEVFRSIFVIEVTNKQKVEFVYKIRWHIADRLRLLKEDQLVQRHAQEHDLDIYYFTILDATNLAFARVHFVSSTDAANILGSHVLLDIQAPDDLQLKQLIFSFENSVTFTKLTNKTTYYVYVKSFLKSTYELTLTLGYNFDSNVTHPISFLTIGDNSRNQMTLQPYQILFIEIRLESIAYAHITNSLPLRLCLFYQQAAPKTHEDMLSTSYCETIITLNTILAMNFNKTGRFHLGIENQNNKSAFVGISTQVSSLRCSSAEMGRTHYFMIDHARDNVSYGYCAKYLLSHRADIQILIGLDNPKMTGIALPTIKIGQWKTLMSTNLKVISGEDIANYCEKEYEDCIVQINFEVDEDHKMTQEVIAVTVSYAGQPLTLRDGLAHQGMIKSGVKHFKYPITSINDAGISVQAGEADLHRVFAKIVTTNDKFIYPSAKDHLLNSTTSYFYPANIFISTQIIKKQCHLNESLGCFILITVQRVVETKIHSSFLIQITQTINFLKDGQRLEKYLEKSSKAYFNYRNTKNGTSLLFFTSSNNHRDSFKMYVAQGNTGSNKLVYIESGFDEVVIKQSKLGWYSIVIEAYESCFFTIQAIASNKTIRELVLGYANSFKISAGEKKYYMVRNEDMNYVKLITNMNKQKMGELVIRGMPITDEEMSDFILFINNNTELTRKDKLAFLWADTNHLTVRQSDSKFCKSCHICYEIQASKDIEGYLTVPLSDHSAVHITGSVSSDILLSGEIFIWQLNIGFNNKELVIALQAGKIKIEVQGTKQINITKELAFDNSNSTKSEYTLYVVSKSMNRVSVKITALENSYYSVSSSRNFEPILPEDKSTELQVGRPNYIFIDNTSSKCFSGDLTNHYKDFILSVSNSYRTVEDYSFEEISPLITVSALVDNSSVELHRQTLKNVIMISFDNQTARKGKTFKICLSIKSDKKYHTVRGNFMFLGNLNYFPEDTTLHFKKNRNLTFISSGRGVVEIDECLARTVLTLSSKYQDIKSMNSRISQRRVGNNLLLFSSKESVFLNIESTDYVSLRWRNVHDSHSGTGYDIYSPSTFRIVYDKEKQEVSVKIQPIQKTPEFTGQLPEIEQIIYQVFIAKEESDLYNAMNCERGEFMLWLKKTQNKTQMAQQTLMKLNNIQDLRTMFRKSEYVLLIVRAEVQMKWPKSNQAENYRFYYPYQEMLLSQFDDHQSDQTSDKTDSKEENSDTAAEWIGLAIFIVLTVMILGLLWAGLKWLRRKRGSVFGEESLRNSDMFSGKLGSEFETKPNEMELKSK